MVPNLRDVGGSRTRDGRLVRTGLLYRSGSLQNLEGLEVSVFGRLGIRRVYDLRGAVERELAPDRLPAGISYVSGDVLADWVEGAPDRVLGWFNDPNEARRWLGNGRAEALWIEQYRKLVTLRSARATYGRIFRELARSEHRPALVHCSGGKDRSGWAAAALLLLLDVDRDTVMADYVQSDWADDERASAMLRALAERGGDPELWRPIVAADPRYLEAALDQVHRSFGSFDAYLADGLGVDAATRDALRAAFLGPDDQERAAVKKSLTQPAKASRQTSTGMPAGAAWPDPSHQWSSAGMPRARSSS